MKVLSYKRYLIVSAEHAWREDAHARVIGFCRERIGTLSLAVMQSQLSIDLNWRLSGLSCMWHVLAIASEKVFYFLSYAGRWRFAF
jgi:hypothetical protein